MLIYGIKNMLIYVLHDKTLSNSMQQQVLAIMVANFVKTSILLFHAPHIQTQRLNVEACLIISDWKADDDERPVEPVFWPPNPEEVKSLINKYIRTQQEGKRTENPGRQPEYRTKELVCGSAEGIIEQM